MCRNGRRNVSKTVTTEDHHMIHHVSIPAREPEHVAEVLAEPQTWPFHVLLSVPHEAEEVERIGAREGWCAKTFGRGMQGHKPFFHVIEFWLENRLLIEVAPPAMVQEYQD